MKYVLTVISAYLWLGSRSFYQVDDNDTSHLHCHFSDWSCLHFSTLDDCKLLPILLNEIQLIVFLQCPSFYDFLLNTSFFFTRYDILLLSVRLTHPRVRFKRVVTTFSSSLVNNTDRSMTLSLNLMLSLFINHLAVWGKPEFLCGAFHIMFI